MGKQLLEVQSVTLAMKGKELLKQKGITAVIERTPKINVSDSCGYSLYVPYNFIAKSREILAQNGIYTNLRSEGGVQ